MSDNELWFAETDIDCNLPTPNTVFVFDEQVNGSWWKWNNLSLTTMVALDVVQDGERFIAGDGVQGFLNEIEMEDKSTDFGVGMTARWKTRWHDAGAPDVVKIWRAIYLNVDQLGAPIQVSWTTDAGKSSGSFSAQYRAKYVYNDPPSSLSLYNNSTGTQVGGIFYNDQVKESLQFSLPQDAVGRRIQFTFTDTSTGTAARILGYQLYFKVRRARYQPEVK